jgi:DNA-binding response OmpR family regulator
MAVRILLVSSGPSLTRQVTSALPLDAEVTEVRTPQRGLALLDAGEHTFDVVLGDADTHPTGGFHMAREIRARQTDGHQVPPIVLMIARPQDDYLAKWSQADAWILKPIDPFDLAEVLEAVGAGRPVPALPGVHTLGHPPRLGPGGGTSADRMVVGGEPRRELERQGGDSRE